ncbi:amino acid deaminase [Paenarthrobacter sp. Z7-10]|uniref:amino acid deaminase n=1 Tax=Paenarthrobacter sp. Z7-10 TaxID=2787635 RepID=UPI0022A96E13|nr:amino acid deaminase [Paenarthrobacter sp. Z7-10]
MNSFSTAAADNPGSAGQTGQQISAEAVDQLQDEVLDWRYKAAPASASGQTAGDFTRSGKSLADLQTPLLTLDAGALRENMDHLAAWCARHGVLLAPHGKTTMAPQLWSEQLRRGAWGISLANLAQLRVARAFGVHRLMLANSLTDPHAIRWVAGESSRENPILSWVDSVQTVELLERTLAAMEGKVVLDVLVEVGGLGGRTGARGFDAALEVARAAANSDFLRLRGISGYEGSLAHAADPESLAKVRNFLLEMKSVHQELLAAKLYAADADIVLTAGGSAYFDTVVEVLGPCIGAAAAESGKAEDTKEQRVDLVIRSGAYIIHDDGFYRQISPFSRHGAQPLRAGMHGWARVVSSPEPGLAILDAGKRDLPVDEGLPVPQAIGSGLGAPMRPLAGSITAVNDQHCFLRFDAAASQVLPGDVVRLGLSHPCTAFDKWTLIPVLADTENDQRVVDLVHTFF